MAAEQAYNLYNLWRDSSTGLISDKPEALENKSSKADGGPGAVKCYRNVIYIWLFHTPLLLNWIEDHHKPKCAQDGDVKQCALCWLLELAGRFWSNTRESDKGFDRDIDEFWKYAISGGWEWSRQNDAQEYMERLFQFLDTKCDDEWTDKLVSPHIYCTKTCKECSRCTGSLEKPCVLKGKMPHKSVNGISLEECFRISHRHESVEDGLCSRCNKRTQHEKSNALVLAPPILPVHIEPAVANNYKSFIKGALSNLDRTMALSSYVNIYLDSSSMRWNFYRLYGVILHFGRGSDKGHFVCAFEQRNQDHWLFFDDNASESVRSVKKSRLRRKLNEMQNEGWKVFLMTYRKQFTLPLQQESSEAIAFKQQLQVSSSTAAQETGNVQTNDPDLIESKDHHALESFSAQPDATQPSTSSRQRNAKRARDDSPSEDGEIQEETSKAAARKSKYNARNPAWDIV